MIRFALILALVSPVGMCAHTETPAVTTACLPLTPYTAAQKADLKAAYDALPTGSPLRPAIQDLTKLRAEARAACGP